MRSIDEDHCPHCTHEVEYIDYQDGPAWVRCTWCVYERTEEQHLAIVHSMRHLKERANEH